MVLVYLFIFAGLVLAVLLVAKRIEEKKRKPVLVLKLISKGDERVREWHHELVQYYSLSKEKAYFFVSKQVPRYSKSSLNKAVARMEENLSRYLDRMRDARLLKKTDGLSEFFKNISEVEKGNGEINEDMYVEEEQSIEVSVVEPKSTFAPEPVIVGSAVEETISIPETVTKPKVKRARRPAATRKLKVVMQEETESVI